MTYEETIEYLYNATPQFQRIGAAAYKPGLDTAITLSDVFGNPHRSYPVIHVAGTNGKGSTCHTLAAILQSAGFRVGLYTSPHLVDFRERIRVDGEMIDRAYVTDFISRYIGMNLAISPSFFELTTILAFDYFSKSKVDIAVIETGLGGRLDTTNIVSPILSVITNISYDHMAQLGDTLRKIAAEKAGIIKPGIPVVIGNADIPDIHDVFMDTADKKNAPIIFSDASTMFTGTCHHDKYIRYKSTPFGDITGELSGDCQIENAATIMNCILQLRRLGFTIDDTAVAKGFANVVEMTGLSGRWMTISTAPDTICDTGHNEGGWRWLSPRLNSFGKRLHMIIGFVNDKDVRHILPLFPRDATYYFTNAQIPRAMPADILAKKAEAEGIKGSVFPDVSTAYNAARKNASPDDTIFIGGSTFIVADILKAFKN